MTIRDVLRKVGEGFGLSEKDIQNSFNFAEASAGQGQDVKDKLDRELTELEVQILTLYAEMTVVTAIADPEFAAKMKKSTEEKIDKN